MTHILKQRAQHMEGYYPVGMERLRAILKRVRPSFNEDLSHSDIIGQEMGFSSIEQVRIIAQIEAALDIDLAEHGVKTLAVGRLCELLEKVD